jgi:drug/metabolite transporter (DMT)-like permease
LNQKNYTQQLLIIGAAIFYGFITVGGKYFTDVGFSLYEISLLLLFTPILLIPVLVIRKDLWISTDRIPFFVMFGLIGALLQLTQFGGIVLGVPVAVVALLLYTQPIWTTVLGRWLLNETITFTKIIAAVLALTGIFVLVDPFHVRRNFSAVGLISALFAGLFLSLWVIWGRKSGLKKQHFVTTTFGYTLFTAIWLLILYPFASVILSGPRFHRLNFAIYWQHWWSVGGYTIFASLTPACLAFAGMRKIEASTAGIILLFEPVSAAILAYLFFKQSLTANIFLGGSLILLANYILIKGSR